MEGAADLWETLSGIQTFPGGGDSKGPEPDLGMSGLF